MKKSKPELQVWIANQLSGLAVVFSVEITEERLEIFSENLLDIPEPQLNQAFWRASRELKWFPKLAELRELAGALPGGVDDGRPGPEEAWARMPKGERMEDDSVVWCDEERAAYDACRGLLREGDPIGARMAFKEKYEKELTAARSQGTPVRWTMSSGYDVEHRLVTLSSAVQEKRLTLESALKFVPGERQNDFAKMLPPSETKGLLVGKVDKTPQLPGLVGILAKMQMEGTVPDGLKPNTRPQREPLSAEELRSRKQMLKQQAQSIAGKVPIESSQPLEHGTEISKPASRERTETVAPSRMRQDSEAS